jgi:glutathione synthase/RimK-type ligase-like ATP-grasp enzyme
MKDMRIAIHSSEKVGFKNGWISYCEQRNIPYKLVNAYHSDIISQLSDCGAFMFQHHQANYKDVLFAKQLLYAVQISGKKVFPDFYTTWHFDDKVGQKYLFESIDAPFVPSYVFYTKTEALKWIEATTFPKVFKLRGGASSANVELIKTKKEAQQIVKKAFGKGFSQYNWKTKFKDNYRKFKSKKANFVEVLRPLYYFTKPYPNVFCKYKGNEKGYVYFQDFIPNNTFDIRLIVIGNKAYGMKRMLPKGDFRASGSELFVYDKIDDKILQIAFDVAKKLKLQTIAFDFIYSEKKKPLIVEMSYAFGTKGSGKCTGYWDKQLNWHEGPFNPYGWMVDMMLETEG